MSTDTAASLPQIPNESQNSKSPVISKSTIWIDVNWLTAFGLTKDSVLEYFYMCPFFDTGSNNQRIRIQGISGSYLDKQNILLSMTGIEYMLDEHRFEEPKFYVIKKQRRRSRDLVDLLDVYYVMDGYIYQCPELLDLFESRSNKSALFLTHCFRDIEKEKHTNLVNSNEGTSIYNYGVMCIYNQNVDVHRIASTQTFEPSTAPGATCGGDPGMDEKKKKRYDKHFPSFKNVLVDVSSMEFS